MRAYTKHTCMLECLWSKSWYSHHKECDMWEAFSHRWWSQHGINASFHGCWWYSLSVYCLFLLGVPNIIISAVKFRTAIGSWFKIRVTLRCMHVPTICLGTDRRMCNFGGINGSIGNKMVYTAWKWTTSSSRTFTIKTVMDVMTVHMLDDVALVTLSVGIYK